MTQAKSKQSTRADREVKLPARDYQPSKAEREQEYDMPGADIETVRRAFFNPVKVRENINEE